MLMCHEVGWCHEITALCGYSDCYPHVHDPLYCPLSIWAKESPSQTPNLKLPGKREVPQCPEQQLRIRPFGTCNFTKFLYKTVESRPCWFWFMFYYSLKCNSQTSGDWDWLCLEGGCWTALHWDTIGWPLVYSGLFSSEENPSIPAQLQKSNGSIPKAVEKQSLQQPGKRLRAQVGGEG